MPPYSTLAPPQSLPPGDIFYSFGSIDSPNQVETSEPIGVVRAGQRCALTQPVPSGESGGRSITYEAEFDAVPTACTMTLEGAMRDVDSEYVTLDTNAVIGVVATHSKTVTGVRQLFLRLRITVLTATPATTIIGKILG